MLPGSKRALSELLSPPALVCQDAHLLKVIPAVQIRLVCTVQGAVSDVLQGIMCIGDSAA